MSYSACGWITGVIKGARAHLPRTFSRRRGGEKPGLIIQEMKRLVSEIRFRTFLSFHSSRELAPLSLGRKEGVSAVDTLPSAA